MPADTNHKLSGTEFGIFQVSIVHNIVHLLFGVAGVAMARTVWGAHRYLLVGGMCYLVLFVYGLLISQSSNVNFLPVNPADDVLHLLLGSTMVLLGLMLNRRILIRPGRPGVSPSLDKSRETEQAPLRPRLVALGRVA